MSPPTPSQHRGTADATATTNMVISQRTGSVPICTGEEITRKGNSTTEVSEASTEDSPQEQWRTARRNNVADQQRSQLSVKTKEDFQDILKATRVAIIQGLIFSVTPTI